VGPAEVGGGERRTARADSPATRRAAGCRRDGAGRRERSPQPATESDRGRRAARASGEMGAGRAEEASSDEADACVEGEAAIREEAAFGKEA